jgi:hypothetical protein
MAALVKDHSLRPVPGTPWLNSFVASAIIAPVGCFYSINAKTSGTCKSVKKAHSLSENTNKHKSNGHDDEGNDEETMSMSTCSLNR